MIEIKQSTATIALVFQMIDVADHITPKTGLTPTVTLSKNGGTFASPAGAVSNIKHTSTLRGIVCNRNASRLLAILLNMFLLRRNNWQSN